MTEEIQESYDDVEEVEESSPTPKPKNLIDMVKQHRYSALVDGICLGMGAVFLLFGIVFPLVLTQQIVYGLFLIISGILIMATGAIVEAYHFGKLR
ncbi:MAG: hypothetical protein QW146_08625 [Candidatus Bathyarchaeia archaeon]